MSCLLFGACVDLQSLEGPTDSAVDAPSDGGAGDALRDGRGEAPRDSDGDHAELPDGRDMAADAPGPADAGAYDANASRPGECPLAPPSGTAGVCKVGLVCEYGANPVEACNTLYTCTSSGWKEELSGKTCPSPSLCPSKAPKTGDPCSADDLGCNFAAELCICASVPSSTSTTWTCVPATPECPVPRFRVGEACSKAKVTCGYAPCAGGVELACDGGSWAALDAGCP